MLVTRTQFDYLGNCVAAWNVARVDAEEYPILNCRKNRNQWSVSAVNDQDLVPFFIDPYKDCMSNSTCQS